MEAIRQLFLKYKLDYTVRSDANGRTLTISVKTDRYWIIVRRPTTVNKNNSELYFADWDREYHGDQVNIKGITLKRVHEILTNKLRA